MAGENSIPERSKRKCTLNVDYTEESSISASTSPSFRSKRLLAKYKDWIYQFKDIWISKSQRLPIKQQVTYLNSKSYVTDLHSFLAGYDSTIIKDDVEKWVRVHKWIKDLTTEDSNSDGISHRRKRSRPAKGRPKNASAKKKKVQFEPILSQSQPEEMEQEMTAPAALTQQSTASNTTMSETVKSVYGADIESTTSSSEAEDRDHDHNLFPSLCQNQGTGIPPVELPQIQLNNGNKDDSFPIVDFGKKSVQVHRGKKEFLLRSLGEQESSDSGIDVDESTSARQKAIEEGRAIFNRMNSAETCDPSDGDVELIEISSPSPPSVSVPVPVPFPVNNERTEENTSSSSTQSTYGTGQSSPRSLIIEIDLASSSNEGDDDSDCDSVITVIPIDMTMATLSSRYHPRQS